MQKKPYLQHHLSLLSTLTDQVQSQVPWSEGQVPEPEQAFLSQLTSLSDGKQWNGEQCTGKKCNEEQRYRGQQLLTLIVARYPHLTPLVHRDLFWFFGGDCLHFMPDEEIEKYQQLDEKRYQAESTGKPFNYGDERAKVFGLH